MMTPEEAIRYIEHYGWSTTRLGLERTRELLARLGDPQRKLKFIHVAGSNGKGSTCAMLDEILRRAGYRTGLYTSPYIQDFCERIRINGENIPGPALAALTERVRDEAEAMADHPSQFELVTAIAMEYYAEQRCDVVVLEVGMGGALDSTNVIDCPEVAVITNIGLEHTEYLGDTLEKIAATKAGIIKPGCRAVCYDGAPEVTEVVCRVCRERGVPLACADYAAIKPLGGDLDGQRFVWKGTEYRLALLGEHQLHNAAVVLETVDALRARGWSIPERAVTDGLARVRWPARLEVMHRLPLFLVDGGHNPQCTQALSESLRALLPGRKVTFLLGVLRDKDYQSMMQMLLPLAERFVCLTPLSPRALPAEELRDHLTGLGAAAVACDDIPSGITAALDAAGEEGAVVAFGSLYLVGAIRGAFPACFRRWLRDTKRRARAAMTDGARRQASRAIVENVLRTPQFQRAGTVMLYRATPEEADLAALTETPEAAGKRFVYPRCEAGGQLSAWEPLDADAWETGTFGIREPMPARSRPVSADEIDLVLCPCVAVDGGGTRLGMGGGYYDRFLAASGRAAVCAAAFDFQRVSGIPAEPWDRPVDLVVTEQGVFPACQPGEAER